ncbi:MAG TPA: glycine--tRNA ligase subunit beta, partial [Alteromonas australica]|nr:glycine--tRNA ligase subunit beta [Alteromonas australica]
VDSRLLQEEAEIALHSALMEAKEKVAGAIEAQDYPVILSTLATLRNTIDSFFDNVMVMAEDEAIKLNRLALLSLLRQLFLTTADISLLAKS